MSYFFIKIILLNKKEQHYIALFVFISKVLPNIFQYF